MDSIPFNDSIYSGSLADYHYPQDKEFGHLLNFLKQIKNKNKVHLTDVVDWEPVYPSSKEYDIYVVCCFGEFINEDFVNKLDNDLELQDRKIIVITSQICPPRYMEKRQSFLSRKFTYLCKLFSKNRILEIGRPHIQSCHTF